LYLYGHRAPREFCELLTDSPENLPGLLKIWSSGTGMSNGDSLYRTILAAPADDAPRLVYADWLEENGHLERAELIRLMVHFPRDVARYRPPRPGSLYWPDAPGWLGYGVRRGFVAEIECPPGLFLAHAADLFARHPITRVGLSDRTVAVGEPGVWARLVPAAEIMPASHFWPVELFPEAVAGDLLTFPSPVRAFAALSAAAVSFGRRVAGLPELKASGAA
jgi:uncharacterized protein (TIGR02996 family)